MLGFSFGLRGRAKLLLQRTERVDTGGDLGLSV